MRSRIKKREVIRSRDKLEELPVRQRVAVVAYYYDGLEIREIADLLECRESKVRSYLYQAEKNLIKGRRGRIRFLTPMLIYIAAETLLTSKAYTMTMVQAKMVYEGVCSNLRLNKVNP